MCSIWCVNKPKKKKRVLIYDEEGLTLFAQQLKTVRTKLGYTQEALAYESGLTVSIRAI